jgi:hypothetical protein
MGSVRAARQLVTDHGNRSLACTRKRPSANLCVTLCDPCVACDSVCCMRAGMRLHACMQACMRVACGCKSAQCAPCVGPVTPCVRECACMRACKRACVLHAGVRLRVRARACVGANVVSSWQRSEQRCRGRGREHGRCGVRRESGRRSRGIFVVDVDCSASMLNVLVSLHAQAGVSSSLSFRGRNAKLRSDVGPVGPREVTRPRSLPMTSSVIELNSAGV